MLTIQNLSWPKSKEKILKVSCLTASDHDEDELEML